MIAGIDLSTKAIDIVLLDEDSDAATWFRSELHGEDAFDRARDVNRAMVEDFGSAFWEDVLAIGIEQPRGNHGVVHIARVQGAVLACLPADTLVQPWNPASWRKTVGLAGNASKDTIRDRVYYLSLVAEESEWPQDACDAYCIALATRTKIQMVDAA